MIDLPDPKSPRAIADWIELYIALYRKPISKLEVASNIEQASGSEPSEEVLSNVWLELNWRQEKYQNELFRTLDKTAEPGGFSGPWEGYIACLIFSLWGAEDAQGGPRLFERLSAEVIKKYLNGEVIFFAWPPFEPNPGQSAIAERVKDACNCIHEKFAESPRAKYKDRGVDLISWIPFVDGRNTQCVILAQCVSGLGWRGHISMPIGSWTQYIHWGSDPIRAFFIPCIIPDADWHDTSRERGILFDRIRIVNLIENGFVVSGLSAEINLAILLHNAGPCPPQDEVCGHQQEIGISLELAVLNIF